MGNKLGRKRHLVDEKYTRPQGLYQHKDVDHKKLRKLILDSKLAPCYPGDDDCSCDLEECPISYLYYPSLNRSRCCTKAICTECFLQMKTPNSTCPSQCPFCKTFNYAVEYRGVKTKEEKGLEQIEEQRVIDAKIRMRLQEIQDEEERKQTRQNMSSSSEDFVSAQQLGGLEIAHSSGTRQNRDDEFDLDNIMLMEAIWLSFQEENKRHHNYNYNYGDTARYAQAESTSSASGGVACTIANFGEHQAGVESSMYNGGCNELVPESFEEQMMVAMAVSLSEARNRANSPNISWH